MIVWSPDHALTGVNGRWPKPGELLIFHGVILPASVAWSRDYRWLCDADVSAVLTGPDTSCSCWWWPQHHDLCAVERLRSLEGWVFTPSLWFLCGCCLFGHPLHCVRFCLAYVAISDVLVLSRRAHRHSGGIHSLFDVCSELAPVLTGYSATELMVARAVILFFTWVARLTLLTPRLRTSRCF